MRILLVGCLSISLVLVMLSPALLAAGPSTSGVTADAPTKCCCGTEDGRCCGMACCRAEAPKPDHSPPMPRPNGNESLSMAFLLCQAAAAAEQSDASRHAAHSLQTIDGPVPSSTLVAQQVLLLI